MSTVFEKLQLSPEELQVASGKWGMKINFAKFKVITSSEKRITLECDELETVGELCLLGSIVPFTDRDVSRRTALASAALGRFINGIFSNRSISTRLKTRLYGNLTLPIAIYGAEGLEATITGNLIS